MSNTNKELLAAFTMLDNNYKSGAIRYIPGTAAGDTPDLSPEAIENPVTAVGIPALAVGSDDDPDPIFFAFIVLGVTKDGDPEVRLLLVKVTTDPLSRKSIGRYSVLNPHDPPSGTWETLAKDVYLTKNSARVAGNPHAVAQVGETLYIIDYDSQKIWPLGIHELDGSIGKPALDHPLEGDPIDLGPGTAAALSENAKGQDLIYLQNGEDEYLFALYEVPDPEATTGYANSVLLRLKKDASSGLFVYDNIKEDVGANAQSIIPVSNSSSVMSLLIPAIGGLQNAGSTNGTESNIYKVADPFNSFSAARLLTGDPMPSSGAPGAFDIAAIAAQAADDGVVYILTFTFDTGYTALNWKLYKTTADQLLNLPPSPPPPAPPVPSPTLSSLETSGVLAIAAQGPTAGIHGYGGLAFWDIVYENGSLPAGDRLWFRRDGILINDARNYGANPRVFNPGLALGQTGGDNINSFDLIAETIRQVKAGVSLKRGFKSFKSQDVSVEEEP
jgi:hypothetical protein